MRQILTAQRSAASAISYKFGYGDDVETFKKEAMKFSLLLDGTLDTPGCTQLLIVNVSPNLIEMFRRSS